MRRWDLMLGGDGYSTMGEHQSGAYVRHSDVAALEQSARDLVEELDENGWGGKRLDALRSLLEPPVVKLARELRELTGPQKEEP